MTPPHSDGLGRRSFIKGAVAATGAVALSPGLSGRSFAFVRSGRPIITNGVQSGDVAGRTAVVWSRTDRVSRMLVDVANTPSFSGARTIVGPVTGPKRDFTAQLGLTGLPPGQNVFYRVRFADLHDRSLTSEPVVGHIRTAPVKRRDVSFVWGGDTAGQGWGIDPSRGGMRAYETMRALEPDFFIHSGDTIYADGPLQERVELPDGTIWNNIVTPEKSKVAETLDEFRGNFRYNLLDEHVRAFNADVPILAQWDDHEVTNNWYPGEVLTDERYTVRDVDVLAARASQAFHEYFPIDTPRHEPERVYRKVAYGPLLDVFFLDCRTYRGPNTANDQPHRSDVTAILGARQVAWLLHELRRSRATWKVIACDMPIGLVVPDGATAQEGIAQGDPALLGREHDLAVVLAGIRRRRVRNTVWVTADVHYCAAHHYDPERATFGDFDPFWEFVAGPIHAGTFGPNALDGTFGPEVRFQRAADRPNQPPSDGLQFVGHVAIDGRSEVMTVRLIDVAGTTLFSVDLEPQRR